MHSESVYLPPFDLYLYGRGEHWDIYRVLGAHPHEQDEHAGYRFAVWAPNAASVHVCGDFNHWNDSELPLYPVGNSGIWAAFVPEVRKGALYKFAVRDNDGGLVLKADPYALATEMRPGIACRCWDMNGHEWGDEAWMAARREQGPPLDRPISVYEVHAGSWRRSSAEPGGGFYDWDRLADELIPYVLDAGFTHIELMPVAEHPLDESWGYQTSHYFAPTSRHGTPEQFRQFVDRCHQAGIGVLLDWVPGHFPKDSWCLGRFDGSALYEHADPRQGEHPDWGTYIFNYGRNEVRNFLFANALYWLKEFHIDGLRIDAVASMIYLDYSREPGDWVPNRHGGRENLEAIDFLKELNKVVHGHFPGVLMVAEESTSWPGVSRPLYTGGLGFTFKWNMGWMHDTLNYFANEPVFRSYHQDTLTFSLLYAFTENFVLPLSHDEVVHGKGALLSKMPGDNWQQFANLRALYSYMWAMPGKKHLFMGGEFGQWNEWNCATQLDWILLDFATHRGLTACLRDLNRILRSEPAMHRRDHDWSGFQWMDFSDCQASVISFVRKAPDAPTILWVCNFTPVVRHGYRVGCPSLGFWREIFNSDSELYGGSNVGNHPGAEAEPIPAGQAGASVSLSLPPLAVMAFALE